jgi:hypothetical protein
METWATRPGPKNVFSRAKLRSMNWSMMTKAPGASSSLSEPTAEGAWRQFLLERTDRAHRNDLGDAGALERIDVGAEVEPAGVDPVAAAVARQEHQLLAVEGPEQQLVGGFPEGGLDPPPFGILEAGDIVDAAAADHAEDRRGSRL